MMRRKVRGLTRGKGGDSSRGVTRENGGNSEGIDKAPASSGSEIADSRTT